MTVALALVGVAWLTWLATRRRPRRRARPVAVYAAHGSRGLIYVGISNAPARRWEQHQTKPWAAHVTRWEVIGWEPTRRQALAVEAHLIRRYDPPANVAGARTPWVDWERIT